MGASNQNIQDIIERCTQGDRSAQYKLYQLYAKAMYNICYRITNNHSDSEDVLQEAFVNAFKNINAYQGSASFGTWLKRIVVNKSIDFIKKRPYEWISVETSFEQMDTKPENTDEADLILNVDRIKRAIQLLPDGYRIIFSLYLLEGYDHGEIAEILKISASTSKSQYSRAKNKLKKILQEEALYER